MSGGITAVTPAADAENPDVIARHYFKDAETEIALAA
jgi:hypothetical protein